MVSRVAASCGAVVGSAISVADVAVRTHCGGATAAIPGSARTATRAARQHAWVAGDVDGDDQRPVGAGAEALGDQVVGPPLGAAVRQRPLVGEAQPQRQHRRGEGEQQDRAADGVAPGVPRRRARPTGAQRTPVGVGASRSGGGRGR